MDKKDKIFVAAFVLCFGLLVFYLGTSITGYVVQATGYSVGRDSFISTVPSSLGQVVLFGVITTIIVVIGIVYFKKNISGN